MAEDFTSNLKVEPKASPPVAAKAPPVGMPKTTKIILEENDNIPPNGQYFGINGRGYLLKAGEPANVPQGIIDTLDNAVTLAPVVDPRTLKVLGHRPRMRFPYRRVE